MTCASRTPGCARGSMGYNGPVMSDLIPERAGWLVALLAYGPFLGMIAVWLAAAALRVAGRPSLYNWLRERLFSVAPSATGDH